MSDSHFAWHLRGL